MPDDLDHPYAGFSSDVIELLRAAHSTTPLHQLLGLQFVNGDDPTVVTVEMPVAPGAFNGSGNLHGGAIATIVDVASGSAAARAGTFRPGENTLVTADLHVRYLGRPKGTVVRAEARVMRGRAPADRRRVPRRRRPRQPHRLRRLRRHDRAAPPAAAGRRRGGGRRARARPLGLLLRIPDGTAKGLVRSAALSERPGACDGDLPPDWLVRGLPHFPRHRGCHVDGTAVVLQLRADPRLRGDGRRLA